MEDASYLRAIRTTGDYAVIRVRTVHGADSLELRIRGAQPTDLLPVLTFVRRMFDLAADPARIGEYYFAWFGLIPSIRTFAKIARR